MPNSRPVIRLGISTRALRCQAAPAVIFDPWLSLANIFAMVCRVIPASRVSVEEGKCFVRKLGGRRSKPDAARRHGSARVNGVSARWRTNRVRIFRNEVSKPVRWHIESRIRNVTSAPVNIRAEWFTYGLDFRADGLGNSRYSQSIRAKIG